MRFRGRLAKIGLAGLMGMAISAGAAPISAFAIAPVRGQRINGGWTNFSAFQNQGQCISYVVTAGKHA